MVAAVVSRGAPVTLSPLPSTANHTGAPFVTPRGDWRHELSSFSPPSAFQAWPTLRFRVGGSDTGDSNHWLHLLTNLYYCYCKWCISRLCDGNTKQLLFVYLTQNVRKGKSWRLASETVGVPSLALSMVATSPQHSTHYSAC